MRQDAMPPGGGFDAADPALLAAGRAAFPGFQLRAVARTRSTQDLALAAARAGAAPGWCVVAWEQSAGRGRQGRSWGAPPGQALLTSIVVSAGPWGGWPALAAGVAVADAVAAVLPAAHPGVRLKWPNDVLGPSGGKLAGVLVEGTAGQRSPPSLVIGIGINVRVQNFPPGVHGASLHIECGETRPPPRLERLLAALLEALARRLGALASGDMGSVATAWGERAAGLGGRIVAETPSGRIEGVARALDVDGALLVETQTGVRRLVAGDVHLLGAR